MLFTPDVHARLASGEITVTFRTWKRPHVKVGGRYRVGPATLLVEDLRRVDVAAITDAEVAAAGARDRAALLKRLGVESGEVWRVEFRPVEPLPPPVPLSDDVVRRRLDRMGPWALEALTLIGERPGVVSTELAAAVGEERFAFKAKVRRLKALGLTESLPVGYRLTPLGERVVRSRRGD